MLVYQAGYLNMFETHDFHGEKHPKKTVRGPGLR